jgi:hypothetical protein
MRKVFLVLLSAVALSLGVAQQERADIDIAQDLRSKSKKGSSRAKLAKWVV